MSKEKNGAQKELVMYFKTEEEAEECLKEWQERLSLSNWIFKVNLVDPDGFKYPGEEKLGECIFNMCHSAAIINILKPEYIPKDAIIKCPHEQTLIHEMLHCKMNFVETDTTFYTANYFEIKEHQLLEELAKALFMAKYQLELSWFKNL